LPKQAPRNKTLLLTRAQQAALVREAVSLNCSVSVDQIKDKIICQDTFSAMDYLPDSCIDLMVVDPPYNLNKIFGIKFQGNVKRWLCFVA